jgi:hypothetical protein
MVVSKLFGRKKEYELWFLNYLEEKKNTNGGFEIIWKKKRIRMVSCFLLKRNNKKIKN